MEKNGNDMKNYKIKVCYQTGDSFSSEESTEIIEEFSWESEEVAKRNLQRIGEHYKLYMLFNKEYNISKEQLTEAKKNAKKTDWFIDNNYWEYSLKIELDDGTFKELTTRWCGYFESLWSAEIVCDKSDTKITFR
jgi:hypothetical protein